MKSNFARLLPALAFIVFAVFDSAYTQAQTQFPLAIDYDLGGGKVWKKQQKTGNIIRPDRVLDGVGMTGLNVQFVRRVGDTETPIEGLSFRAQIREGGPTKDFKSDADGFVHDAGCSKSGISFTVTLTGERFKITNGTSDYIISLGVKCGMEQKVVFDEKTENGQPIGIWQVAVRAGKKLSQNVSMNFWKNTIKFVWPAQGDYYTMSTVNLTLGYQWDVVAHEMGHAIYDQAKMGAFGGGEHYIDRCYSDALALSEGWASFFSAWVNLELTDVDAKFQYMVPRRAPIRFENIPADVCGTSKNEWRVIGWLWDLIDYHDDGETMNEAFAKLWNDSVGARASSLSAMKARLVQKGWDSGKLETIWKLNFPTE